MTPSTIRKIKLGNVALYALSISSFPLMQSFSLACVVQDRALRRALIKTGLYCFALYPALYGLTANFLFSVVKTSFLAFLETAMRMTASTASTASMASLPTLPQGEGERAPRRTSVSALAFMRRQIVPDDGSGSSTGGSSRQLTKREPKNETVQRIEAQVSAINKNMIFIPIVTGAMLLLVISAALSDSVTYEHGGVLFFASVALWGIFLVGSTMMMYNLGTRKRINAAARKQSRKSATANASGSAQQQQQSSAQLHSSGSAASSPARGRRDSALGALPTTGPAPDAPPAVQPADAGPDAALPA
jgi:hypothetical protein